MILGIVLIAVLLVFAARVFYVKFWLERSDRYHRCSHCGEFYQDEPFYCPHCGEVVDQGSEEN